MKDSDLEQPSSAPSSSPSYDYNPPREVIDYASVASLIFALSRLSVYNHVLFRAAAQLLTLNLDVLETEELVQVGNPSLQERFIMHFSLVLSSLYL